MLPGTLTAEGKERAYALMHTEILYGYMHMHSRQENTHAIVPTYTHTHTQTQAVLCHSFHRMHAALSCQPFIWKCMRQKFLLGVVPEFMAQHCTTVLRVCDLSYDDESKLRQHPFEVSLTSREQQICCEPITTMCLGPLYILSQLKSVRNNSQAQS